MKIEAPFLDIYGLVLPNPKTEDKPCDNGVLFTSVAVLLGFEVPNYKELIRECYLEPGLIARWKGNNFDQAAWDDYMAAPAACIYLKDTSIAREILSYGIKHFFVYNTDNKLEGRDFLLRNVPIWPIVLLSAFPSFKSLIKPFAWIVQKFFNDPKELLQRNDTSGLQLQWIYLEACKLSGIEFSSYKEHKDLISQAFSIYYSKDHPFNTLN